MFVTGKTLVVTTEELEELVGKPRYVDGHVILTDTQNEMFRRLASGFIRHRCEMAVSGTILAIQVAVAVVIGVVLITDMHYTTQLTAYALPGAFLLITFILQLFQGRIVNWMFLRYELMVVTVNRDKKGTDDQAETE